MKFFFIIFFCLTTIFGVMGAASERITVDLSLKPRATYVANEFIDAYDSRTIPFELATLSLVNNTAEKIPVVLRIQIFLDKVDAVRPLADYVTNFINFPIYVPPNGAKEILSTELTEAKLKGGTKLENRNIEKELKKAYGETFILDTSGLFPEDTITFRVLVFKYDKNNMNVQNVNEAIGMAQEKVFIPLEYGNIDVIQPVNGTLMTGINMFPSFIWAPLNVRKGINVTYTFELWKLESGDPQSVIGSTPLLSFTTTETQARYPANAESLVLNQEYVWRVTAKDEMGFPIGIAGSSELCVFKFGEYYPPEIVDKEQLVKDFPIRLFWDSQQSNTNYYLTISDRSDMSSVILYKMLSGQQFILDELNYKSLIHPRKTYYWQVAMDTDDNQKVVSDVATFRLDQSIDLYFPMDEQISEEFVYFYWEGIAAVDKSSYVLYIADNPNFNNALSYDVQGNTFQILSRDGGLDMKPTVRYFWKISGVDQLNQSWGDSSQVGSFYLADKLFSPVDLFAPVYMSDGVLLAFDPDFNAVSYRFEVYTDDLRERIYELPIQGGSHVFLDPTKIEEIDLRVKYRWRIVAVHELGKEVASNFSSFEFNQTQTISFVVKPDFFEKSAVITWEKLKTKPHKYEVEFCESPLFNPSEVWSYVTKSNRFYLRNLQSNLPDVYYRVKAVNKNWNVIAESEITFLPAEDIAYLVDVGSINLIEPNTNQPFSNSVVFKWQPELMGDLLIATSKTFRDALSFKVDGVSKTLEKKLDPNMVYYWTIKPRGSDLNLEDSNIATFKLALDTLRLLQPLQKKVVDEEIVFQWVGDPDGVYRLFVAEDIQFKNAEVFDVDSALMKKYSLLYEGKFYWKIQQLNKDDLSTVVAESKVSYVERVSDKRVSSAYLNKFEQLIKSKLDQNSSLKRESWYLSDIKFLDDDIFSDKDLKFLIQNQQFIKSVDE